MKLKYSTSLVNYIYIHIIIVHIIFVHLPTQIQATDHEHEDANYYEITDQNKKLLIEQVKANLLKVLGLKEVPKRPLSKAFVPLAILEEYKRARESVRDTIPDDRDYYGKISLDDLDQRHEDYWSGDFGIEVDMARDKQVSKQKRFAGEVTKITHVPSEGEPKDVASNLEHLLPPHSRSAQSQKQFISVHLRFNLSQELYLRPTSADELRGAELHLNRERIIDCESNDCDRKSVPFFSKDNSSTEQTDDETKGPSENTNETKEGSSVRKIVSDNSNNTSDIIGASNNSSGESGAIDDTRDSFLETNKLHINRPRYQRVYILHITGYDKHNEPIATIHDSQRVDTSQSVPLVFDIYKIIKYWLKNPSKNYGIIVRVTNDDKKYEQQVVSSVANLKNPTNASSKNASPTQLAAVAEHVILKRGFRSASESDETWRIKQPSLLLYIQPLETARSHVKRNQPAADLDDVQADEQLKTTTTTSDYTSNDPVQSNQTNDDSQSKRDSQAQANEPISTPSGTMETSTSSSQHNSMNSSNAWSKRDSRQANLRSASGTRSPAATVTPSQGPRNRGRGKSSRLEKCSKRSLEINFEDVGWSSWIIAPHSYHANYCAGDCTFPMSDHQNATNHAIIQSIYQAVRANIPRSCCAPVKLSSMNILYQLDGVVEMRSYNDMIVESCGCL